MKKYLFATLALFGLMAGSGSCQTIDTLVDVGGYRLAFHIVKGTGMPILFDAGSGDDGSGFYPILKPIADVSGATLITYSRAGFGRSEVDPSNQDIGRHGVLNGVEGLEAGLRKLGYAGNIMLVSCSYGNYCVMLYAWRHPSKVKAAVMIDGVHVSFFTDAYVDNEMRERMLDTARLRNAGPGVYYQSLNLRNTVELVRRTPFPSGIPVIDLVSEINLPDSVLSARWRDSHRQFVAGASNREGITARGCSHVIFRDNPYLVVSAIVKAYVGAVGNEQGYEIMKRYLSYSLVEANSGKRTVQ
ncbi:MAG: alpha/beta hydrolase [Bacteroidetes bacterium]|nr:alpha/beta hydrolase [Bacteroidota bacterium]